MSFKVGKDVIAIKSHSSGVYKKDDIFKLFAMSTEICKCGTLYLDLGFKLEGALGVECAICEGRCDIFTNTFWFSAKNFIPLDDIVTIEEILEELHDGELV